jgi:ferredoxin-type protein NapH
LIFGMGFAWLVIFAVFLFDLFVAQRGWCGHVCPVGAFYSLIGRASVLRVHLPQREACNNCMDCYAVCPEFQVIKPALKAVDGAPTHHSGRPVRQLRALHRCVLQDVFAFGARFSVPDSKPITQGAGADCRGAEIAHCDSPLSARRSSS